MTEKEFTRGYNLEEEVQNHMDLKDFTENFISLTAL